MTQSTMPPTQASAAPLAPEYVRCIAPYVAGKPIEELARELGLDPATIVKLASNENPRGASPAVVTALAAAAAELTRYPDSNAFALKDAIARRFAVKRDEIVLGNGSNDILELVSLAFLTPGDDAIYSQYAFVVYPLATQARGARGIEVPARDFGHDLVAMRAAITPKTRVVFVANPNNPTGTWIEPAAVEHFLASVPANVLVVLDEAYNEYLDAAHDANATRWIERFPNLVVSRTFSKAYGLAGLRVGYGVMNAGVADMVNRVRPPFNVNSYAQVAAIAALADRDYVDTSRAMNTAGKRDLAAGFDALGLRHLRSHGNFIMVEVGDGNAVFQKLLRAGVIVRPVANYGLPAWLRVTIGLPQENARLLAALPEALGRDSGAR